MTQDHAMLFWGPWRLAREGLTDPERGAIETALAASRNRLSNARSFGGTSLHLMREEYARNLQNLLDADRGLSDEHRQAMQERINRVRRAAAAVAPRSEATANP